MTRMVQLSDEAYRRLAMSKRQGESFSEAVLRLLGRGDLSGLRGLRGKKDLADAERALRAVDALDRP